jgi:hypothetical protein
MRKILQKRPILGLYPKNKNICEIENTTESRNIWKNIPDSFFETRKKYHPKTNVTDERRSTCSSK